MVQLCKTSSKCVQQTKTLQQSDKLKFIIDGDDETRYSDENYVQYLRTGKTIYKDEIRETP